MVDEVLAFWFGDPPATLEEYGAQMRRWFRGGAALDAEIIPRFGALVARAIAGELDDWAATTRGRLALILLLDQFTRSVYRDDPRMYAGDARAQALANEALDRGLHHALPVEQRNFMIMPLLHAEDIALQERGVVEMAALYEAGAAWQRQIHAMGIEQSQKYRDVIARFGRFPHRNKILGRTNTADEDVFLRDWEAKQPPAGQRDL